MWFRNWRFYLFHVNTYFFKWISLYITNQNFKQIQLYTGLLQGKDVTFLELLSPLMFPEQYIPHWHESFEWFKKQTHKCVGWKFSTESSIMNIQTYLSAQSYSIDEYVLFSCILPVLYNLYFYVLFYIVSSLWLNFGFMGVTHVQLKPFPWMLMDESITTILRYHHRPFRQ